LALLRRPRALSKRAAVMLVLGLAAMTAMVSVAAAEIIGPKNAGHLTAVGPVSESDGFPVWYKDDTNTKLEFCLDQNDPNCGFLPGDVPDETKPVSFPDNWPEEIFYFLAGSDVTAPGGGSIVATLGLEATFANGAIVDGDQIVFGRVRFVGKGLTPNTTYTITHPYGVDKLTSDGDGALKYVEDIGVNGGFGASLNSRIGPFLKWDPAVAPAAPQGYLGDPNVEHAITGSPFNTNVLKACATGADGTEACAQNEQFTVQGKIATNGGVEPVRATYSRDATAGNSLDVFATSDLGTQSLEVSGDGIDATRLRGENGNYVAHVEFTGDVPPASVKVSNVGDTPVSSKTIPVTDGVEGHATYDADTSELVVDATSTDTVGTPALTAKGFGDLAGGTKTVAGVAGPPASVTVTSAAGGSVDLPVDVTGAGFPAIPVQAFAGTDQQVLQGETVTLDGSASTGPVKSYSWTQAAADAHQVDLTGGDTAQPTFTAPTLAADEQETTLHFELTVDGAGGPSTATVSVLVKASAPTATASAGPDQTVDQNSVVTLDASASTDATKFAWKQLDGPATVSLTGDTTAQPTFRAPKVAGTFTFEVTATGPGGSSTDQVKITARPDTLTTSQVQFRRGEWRIDGTSTVAGPGVTVKITVAGTGQLVAIAGVDTLGAFRYRGNGPTVANGARVNLESSSGGTLTVPVTVRN
jgi:hypothetical protein